MLIVTKAIYDKKTFEIYADDVLYPDSVNKWSRLNEWHSFSASEKLSFFQTGGWGNRNDGLQFEEGEIHII